MILFLNSLVFDFVLSLVLQKRHRVDYGSDEDELERMLVALEGGSDSAAGDGSGRAALSVVFERLEFSTLDFAEPVESPTSLSSLQILDPASDIKVEILREVMPPEGISGFVPPTEEPAL